LKISIKEKEGNSVSIITCYLTDVVNSFFTNMEIQHDVNTTVKVPDSIILSWGYHLTNKNDILMEKDIILNIIDKHYVNRVYALYDLPAKLINAIQEEFGELLADSGYTWWKKKHVDSENIIIEVVDIYHFLLSYALLLNVYADYVSRIEIIGNTIDEMSYQSKSFLQRLLSITSLKKLESKNYVLPHINFVNRFHNKANKNVLQEFLINNIYKGNDISSRFQQIKI